MKKYCLNFVAVLASTLLFYFDTAAAQTAPADNHSETTSAPPKSKKGAHVYPSMGMIERNDPGLDSLIPTNARIELLASGFSWSEGPIWVRRGGYLLFSDVPRNIVFKWQEGERTTEYLMPSGYTGSTPRAGEPGSNGLTLDSEGRLVLCQHGDRRVARLDEGWKFTPLARYYKYRRFNSPNDLVFKSNGDLYFTDPPYGLAGNNADPTKELMFNGVYRVTRNGEVTVLTQSLSFPNGITLSPDERMAYIAVSDEKNPIIMAYDLTPDGLFENGRVFFDTTPLMAGRKGVPDGLKVDKAGNLFATGPGGVLIISPAGKHLGTINTGEPTANCAWGNDGSVLYITANDKLCRVKTITKGRIP